MLRELVDGATVRSATGDDLGKIDQFVIDPSTREVTHLVVRKGLFFPDDRVVPASLVNRIENGDAILAADVDLEALPPFEVHHYVPVDADTRAQFDESLGEASMWRYPVVGMGMYPAYPWYPTTDPALSSVTERNVPPSGVVVNDGTTVQSRSGEEIGHVTEVTVDENGELSHLVVDLGFLSGHRVLPAHWIDSISEEAITVAVGDEALAGLDEWRAP